MVEMAGGGPIPVPSGQPKGEKVIMTVDDIKEAADQNLDPVIRDFYNDGAGDMRTLNGNMSSLASYYFRSRVMVDVSKLDMSTMCFGRKISFPLCISPAGCHAMAHPDGELATARACAAKGINMGISSFANHSVEDITAASAGTVNHAMQLYTMQDRKLQERIIRRAEKSGCKAILLTGDSPVLGVRYNEWRNDFRISEGLNLPMMERDSEMIRKVSHDDGFDSFNDGSHHWARDIPWLRQRTKMRIWIKGILTAEDVELAAVHGCDGVLISNHGGRQLDGVPSTIDALLECAPVARRLGLGIHIDGGFRKGSDIFVALALGAECVWVGRPALWGLAYDGQAGVEKMIDVLQEDFRRCMAMCGCNSIADINKSCLSRMGLDGVLRRVTKL